ncbi:MAG: hypothetical protein M3291_01715 [Actinomycetota bacterium]|nr:hypothetical protein [Actinomycetota bacterium]
MAAKQQVEHPEIPYRTPQTNGRFPVGFGRVEGVARDSPDAALQPEP